MLAAIPILSTFKVKGKIVSTYKVPLNKQEQH